LQAGWPMELYDLLQHVVKACDDLDIPYLVTGSIAAMAYGEPRFTNDIDIVADIHPDHIPSFLAAFPEDDFYLSEDAIRDAIERHSQFNIIHPASGLKVDIMVRKPTPFDESRFQRRQKIRPAQSYEADFASPEDVILKKLEYYRDGGSEKHLRDIASMLKISAGTINETYVTEWADRMEVRSIWDAIQRRLQEESD
jgi:hypothetical protein